MMHFTQFKTTRAALGAALIGCLGACADAPSAPWPQVPRPDRDAVVASPADNFLRSDGSLVATANETITRRMVSGRDGARYVVESVRGEAGLPRAVRISRDGRTVAMVSNEWRATTAGFALDRQRLTRFVDGRTPMVMDSREMGGVASLAEGALVVNRRSMPVRRGGATGVLLSARLRALEEYGTGDGSADGGPCDVQARAAQSAIEDWTLSVVAVVGATASGNPFTAWSAYAYQLKKYRDMERAEANLDLCVANAGKPIEEY